jgi:hypothetical protein
MKKFVRVGLLIAATTFLAGCSALGGSTGTDNSVTPVPTSNSVAVICTNGEADYTISNSKNTLVGVCKKVVISGHNVTLTAADVTDLTVSGDKNVLDVAVLGTVTVVGDSNSVKTTTVGPLTISGNSNTVTALGPIGDVVVTGANDTVTTPSKIGTITQSGIGNKIGAP